MKTIAFLLLLSTPAMACDKLVINCTPANVAFDKAQKGPVAKDPLEKPAYGHEYSVRLPNQG